MSEQRLNFSGRFEVRNGMLYLKPDSGRTSFSFELYTPTPGRSTHVLLTCARLTCIPASEFKEVFHTDGLDGFALVAFIDPETFSGNLESCLRTIESLLKPVSHEPLTGRDLAEILSADELLRHQSSLASKCPQDGP